MLPSVPLEVWSLERGEGEICDTGHSVSCTHGRKQNWLKNGMQWSVAKVQNYQLRPTLHTVPWAQTTGNH